VARNFPCGSGERELTTGESMNRFTLLAAAALVVAAPAARAQSGVASLAPVTAPEAGPAVSSLSAGARPVAAARLNASAMESEAVALRRRARFSRAETLMIIGGATFLTGAIIGDDAGTIVMVGGAAVGLYGLYLYLQQ
jgi:hypothetical protein